MFEKEQKFQRRANHFAFNWICRRLFFNLHLCATVVSKCLSQWLTLPKHCFNLTFQSICPVWEEDSEKEQGGERREENRGTEMTDSPRLHSAVPALINHTCLSDTAPSYTLMISAGLFIHSTPSPMIPLFKGFAALKAPLHAGGTVYFSILCAEFTADISISLRH